MARLSKRRRELVGWLEVAIAVSTPLGAWASNESSLRASVFLGVIGGLIALRRWLSEPPGARGQIGSGA